MAAGASDLEVAKWAGHRSPAFTKSPGATTPAGGIRKAIGARRRDILSQFLAEAVLSTLAGGLLGVAAGLAGSQIKIIGVTPVVQPFSVLLALAVAVESGCSSGSTPPTAL